MAVRVNLRLFQPKVKPVRQNAGPPRTEMDATVAIEERNKAFRELFRMRKSLNKELRRLNKETEDLASGAEL